MELHEAKNAARIVTALEVAKDLVEAVESKTAQWTQFSFKGEDGGENHHSIEFGGITCRRGEWERDLIKSVRQHTLSLLKKRVADFETELAKS